MQFSHQVGLGEIIPKLKRTFEDGAASYIDPSGGCGTCITVWYDVIEKRPTAAADFTT